MEIARQLESQSREIAARQTEGQRLTAELHARLGRTGLVGGAVRRPTRCWRSHRTTRRPGRRGDGRGRPSGWT